jgi:hypothetical protein
VLSEDQSSACQPVDVGGTEFCLSVTTQVAVAKIVCKYENHVWPLLVCSRCATLRVYQAEKDYDEDSSAIHMYYLTIFNFICDFQALMASLVNCFSDRVPSKFE